MRVAAMPGSGCRARSVPFSQPGRITSLRAMTKRRSADVDSDSWKKRIGVEFSGLERPRDFLVAFAFLVGFVMVAAVIAWIAFG